MLGVGSYGNVRKGEIAVKKLNRLSDLLQEYSAMQACRDCPYIVDPLYIDIENLEIAMKKYDGDLRRLLNKLNRYERETITKDLLLALIYLHDRDLLHGDIKPNNILINLNPLEVVLADCGFLSVTKKSRVKYGNWFYKGLNPINSPKQDIYSLGIVFLEIFGNYRISQSGAIKDDTKTYPNLKEVTKNVINNRKLAYVISLMVSFNVKERPTARQIYSYLYRKYQLPEIIPLKRPYLSNLAIERKESNNEIRNFVKTGAHSYNIYRCKNAFKAFIDYSLRKGIPYNEIPIYGCAAIIIAVSILSDYTFKDIDQFLPKKLGDTIINKFDIIISIKNLLNDSHFCSDILYNELM